jgi:hypothetical protein
MADETAEIQSLINGLQHREPRLYAALDAIVRQLQTVYLQLNPLVAQSIADAIASINVTPPTTFTFIFTQLTVRFNWSSVADASAYEVRLGSNWDTAIFQFNSTSLQADIDPLLYGTYTFLIKSISSTGTYSEDATSVIVLVSQISAVTISYQLIDNNVLLFWNEPVSSSFKIDHYKIQKDGVDLGNISGTFFTRFETTNGVYTYAVIPVDVAGNEGTLSSVSITVNSPPDYELQDSRVSTFTGTKTDTIITNQGRLLASWAARTFKQHFDDHAWSTVQDQITAGYPIYIQSTTISGFYEEKVDYGTVISNIIAAVTWNELQIAGVTTVVVKMAVSTDDITYSAFVAGAVQFYSSFRYIKYKLEFTGASDIAVYEVYNLTFRLDVKREQDGDVISAVSTDVGGTTVNFNKSFKDIDAITATPMGTADRRAIIDFTDLPNPSGFKVLLFDSAGARVSGDVRWVARGII